MKRLSKEKRTQLIIVLTLTALGLAGIWFGIISAQQQSLTRLSQRKLSAAQKLEQVTAAIQNGPKIQAELGQASKALEKMESDMASGDLYSWAINTIRQFKLPYKVEIPQFSQIDGPKDVTLLPQFPYKQATLTVGGTAYFHDFGKFVADFENQFPYFRLVNLSLEPSSAAIPGDQEKLSFKMEIVTLVKPSNS